jgi:galactokinase
VIGFRAPGRVNLIGEHVDYAGGLVLPAALEQGVSIRGVVRDDGVIRLVSGSQTEAAEIPIAGDRSGLGGWARYVGAVVDELAFLGIEPPGFDGTVESDLPTGSGLSSSAALEVALAGILTRAAGATLDGMPLAELGQRAELRAVGVPCGIMDQAASVLGTRDHALLLDCATLEHRPVRLSNEIALVVIDTGVRRRLEDSEYARRRAEIETVLAAIPAGAARGDPDEALHLAERAGVTDTGLRRLRHVVTENHRVEGVVSALEKPGGVDEAALGALFEAGHASLRDDFEVSIPELDLLVELAREEGAIAARMTGGGFGGAIVALVPDVTAAAVAEHVSERYEASTGRTPTVVLGHAGAGAGGL